MRKGAISISKDVRLNEQIRANELRVIDENGHQLGVLSRSAALELAAQAELDLVEISPQASPPVVKIIDWGKYNYQRTKQQQKNKKSVKIHDIKQMRMGLKIGEHDLQVKLRKVTGFLENGHKVKITLFFRGRELAHKDLGYQLAQKIIDSFAESIVVEQQPQMTGKQLVFSIRSNHAKAKNT